MNPIRDRLRTVVVTGGASGLGAAIVRAVAEAGGTPVVLDVAQPEGDVDHERVDHERVDLADTDAAHQAVGRVSRRHGGITAVVTAAGIDACGRLADVPAKSWEQVIAVNLLGTAAVIRASLGDLEANRGAIVTVGSTLGLRALPDATAYCASKFAIVGFTRSLAVELAGRVGVTMLVPGGMRTAFFDGRAEQYRPPADSQLNDPGDVAAAALFALSQPPGCEIREMVVVPSTEPSWP